MQGFTVYSALDSTWVDLSVGRDSVSVDDVLEHTGELVGPIVCWRRHLRHHTVQNRWYTASTLFLYKKICKRLNENL